MFSYQTTTSSQQVKFSIIFHDLADGKRDSSKREIFFKPFPIIILASLHTPAHQPRSHMNTAHCQPGFLASLVAVFGEYDISGDLESKRSVTKNVKRVIVHRQYDAATFENDLAILELESPVRYDSHIGKHREFFISFIASGS